MMDSLTRDLRHAMRGLAKSPGFTAAAVLALALGIGANASVFSLVNGVMLRPMPVPHPERLVTPLNVRPHRVADSFSYPDYADLRDQSGGVLEGMLGHNLIHVALSGAEENEVIWGEIVTGNYFDVLGVTPAPGRGFLPEEDRGPGSRPVVVLSDGLWRRRFGGDPSVIGRPVTLNGRPFSVVGVAPPGFLGTKFGLSMDLWVPMAAHAIVMPGSEGMLESRGSRWLKTIARLKPGVPMARAEAAMKTVARRLEETYPGSNAGMSLALVPERMGQFPPEASRGMGLAAALAMGLVGLVLLISCANVAHMLLARASARRREIGIRLALGAGRGQVIRQLLTESLLLALMGGVGGILIALWSSDLFLAFLPPIPYPLGLEFTPDTRVLAFTLAASLLTVVFFGLAPALQASRLNIVPALRAGEGGVAARRRPASRGALVAAQVALSLVVLAGAGLFLRSLQNAARIETGFRKENVLLATFDVGLLGYTEDQGRVLQKGLTERVRALPGVMSLNLARHLPLGDSSSTTGPVLAEGEPLPAEGRGLEVGVNVVGPGHFETLGTPLVEGRDFDERDTPGSPAVIIVNEALARRLWPGERAVGRRLTIGTPSGESLREVIGVAKDGKYRFLGESPQPYAYRPLAQAWRSEVTLIVRAAGDPLGLIEPIRREVRALDPRLPLFDVKTLEDHMRFAFWWTEMGAALSGTFGGLALLLAALGLYGVMAFTVARRTREIGIRMALGARPADVVRLVVRHGMSLVGAGMIAGLAGALALASLMESLLYGVGAADPVTFTAVPVLLAGVAFLACWMPARRAARIDPIRTLRYE